MSSATMSSQRMGVKPNEKREGPAARAIEEYTTEIPSDVFLWAAGGAIAGSLYCQMTGRSKRALFIGQWVPTFLILGLYNKLVKLKGSE